MEWLPIETAPQDGTPFLGYLEKLKPSPVAIWWRVQHSIRTGKPVWYLYGLGELWDVKMPTPTHWMPLPNPPA
jgi:hypothetical protein